MWGTVASLGASLLSNYLTSQGQEAANEQNVALQRENQEWLEKMSNTAHQREINDLRSAGLNPILTATGGSGASTPASQPAKVESTASHLPQNLQTSLSNALGYAQLENSMEQVSYQAAQMASQIQLNQKQMQKIDEEIANIRANTGYQIANTDTTKSIAGMNTALSGLYEQKTDTEYQQTRKVGAEAEIKQAQSLPAKVINQNDAVQNVVDSSNDLTNSALANSEKILQRAKEVIDVITTSPLKKAMDQISTPKSEEDFWNNMGFGD